MDSMPDMEFHVLFNRISRRVDLKGANSPSEINSRLYLKIEEIKYDVSEGEKDPQEAKDDIRNLKKAIFAGFSRRVIKQAINEPYGIESMTLRLGWHGAREIIKERQRRMG